MTAAGVGIGERFLTSLGMTGDWECAKRCYWRLRSGAWANSCHQGRGPIASKTREVPLSCSGRNSAQAEAYAPALRGRGILANPIITLTTDYGTNDHLVGVLKAVILKINPEATIVDITHAVTPFDLLDGALAIAAAYSYFPPKAIHVVVVDPGVGTDRRPLLVSGQNQYFIAPDNGVLSFSFEGAGCLRTG